MVRGARRFPRPDRLTRPLFAGGLLQEAGALDDHSGDAARRHQAVAVAHRDPECETAALNGLERGLGAHLAPHRGGREVIELHSIANAGGAVGQLLLDREHGCLLRQRDDSGCGEHGNVAGLQCERGVVFCDDELDGSGQTGM